MNVHVLPFFGIGGDFETLIAIFNEYADLDTVEPGDQVEESLGAAGEVSGEKRQWNETLLSIVSFGFSVFFWVVEVA